jgi:hypothetical protein
MDIFSILGSVVSGGATGVIGSAISSIFNYKNKQLEYKHDLDMEIATRETMKEEWAQRTKIAEVEGATQSDLAAQESFQASMLADKATYSAGLNIGKVGTALMVTIDFLRGIIRPVSTILFISMSFYIYFSMKEKLVATGADPTGFMDLFNQVTTVILYLATTTVCWWFGVRGESKWKG